MKIVYITTENPFNTQNNGGIGTYTGIIAGGLASKGHEIHIVTLDSEYEKSIKLKDTSHLHTVKASDNKYTGFIENSIRIFKKVREINDRAPIDLIESQEWFAPGFVTKIETQIPFITRLHTPLFLIERINETITYRESQMINDFEKRQTLSSHLITSPSTQIANIVFKEWGAKSYVIPNPIDSKEAYYKEENFLSGPYILFMGRLEYRKGVITLAESMVDILRKWPNVKLVFCGRDTFHKKRSIKKAIENILQDNLNQIIFIDHITGDRKKSLIQKASVVVLPSYWENFSYVGLETLIAGTKLIATRDTGFEEMIVHEETGYLVKPNNPYEIGNYVNVILSGEDYLDKQIIVSNTAKRFHINALIQRYAEIYNSIIRK